MNPLRHASNRSNDTNTARAAMRHLGAWLATGLVLLLLNACGGGSDSIENQIVVRKTMVVGSAEEIAQKRNATKSVKKNKLNASVLHTKHVKGVPVSDDAPRPYILSSGHILVNPRQLGLVHVAMHENTKGKISDVAPARFHSSDPTVVSAVRADPAHPNAVLLTMTGKKGNSFITSYESSGNAISKFMVLSAQPADDVLVISDSNIHPTLCKIVDTALGKACPLDAATDFDQGHIGVNFKIDDYIEPLNCVASK